MRAAWTLAVAGLLAVACLSCSDPLGTPPATGLKLTVAPDVAASGFAFAIQPTIELRSNNKRAPVSGTPVTMSVSSGAVVIGTATAVTTNGVASFTDVGINGPAGYHTLTFAAPGLSPVTHALELIPGLDWVVLIPFGPLFDCGEPSLFSTPEAIDGIHIVPLGASVEWLFADWVADWYDFRCAARIVSTVVPPGGEHFDSGVILDGERFRFTPRVVGTWEFGDIMNGGTGRLIVR